MTLGDRVAVLNKGEIQQIGTPRELYSEPRNLFVAGFIGSPAMNFLPAEIRDGRLVLPMAELPLPEHLRDRVPPGQRHVIAGIRPEHMADAALVDIDQQPGAVFGVNVEVVEWLGADLYVHFQVEGRDERLRGLSQQSEGVTKKTGRISLIARVDPSSRAAENQRLAVWLNARYLNLFDPDTGVNLGSAAPRD
jgi:multiple sugar transport system ATP-binding protein